MTDHRPADPRAVHSAVQFLMTLHFINWLGFAGWNALLHNYTIQAVGFGWFEAGLTQTVREIPGFLAFTVAFWLMIMREQVLGYIALVLLGLGVALTGTNPTLMGVLMATFIMSVGFHYFETTNTSLQLQLLPKAQARPRSSGASSAQARRRSSLPMEASRSCGGSAGTTSRRSMPSSGCRAPC
ncbi:MAG: hypothetical protein J0I57_15070 [Hyphomicrobium sp.]|nr:hypothetical protein [Hyphomicrobium sp.]MBN9268116.1 hypothetical protein [Hyphomicrobium sp.]MBN9278930.1 hypothetical protein [Hyphomicrobium sp.]